MMSFSFLVFNRVVISIYQLALTSFALCGRLDKAALIPIFAIGSALVTMIGQNAVRGQFERVRKIWRTTLLSVLIVVFGAAHLIMLLRMLLLSFPVMLLLVYVLDMEMYGVWYAMIAGNVVAAGVSAFWTGRTLKKLERGTLKISSSGRS